jgi:hypothetical protein
MFLVEVAGGFHFAQKEPVENARSPVSLARPQHFDRDGPSDRRILGTVHDSHSPSADHVEHDIFADLSD